MIFTDRPPTAICGACGANLMSMWHYKGCPSLEPGWNAKCEAAFKGVNSTQKLIQGLNECLKMTCDSKVVNAMLDALQWACAHHAESDKALKTLFPFTPKE